MYKTIKKHKYVTHLQTTTMELQAPDFGQTRTACGGVKHVCWRQTLPISACDSGVIKQSNINYLNMDFNPSFVQIFVCC